MQKNKLDRAGVVFLGWILGTQLFAFLLFGPIKRYHGPELLSIPYGQFALAAYLSAFGSILHVVAYLLLPTNIIRNFGFAVVMSLMCAAATYVALHVAYDLAPIRSLTQPEAATVLYLGLLSLAVGTGVTVGVIRAEPG